MNDIHKAERVARTRATLEIDVVNHSGVMSHIVGLFSRRQFNVEGILCLPVGDGCNSRIWLLVDGDSRLPQMILQLRKLEDVIAVRRHDAGLAAFGQLERLFTAGSATGTGD